MSQSIGKTRLCSCDSSSACHIDWCHEPHRLRYQNSVTTPTFSFTSYSMLIYFMFYLFLIFVCRDSAEAICGWCSWPVREDEFNIWCSSAAVKSSGSLWTMPASTFESGNGALLKLAAGAKGVPHQVMRWALTYQELQGLLSLDIISTDAHEFCLDTVKYGLLKKIIKHWRGMNAFWQSICLFLHW